MGNLSSHKAFRSVLYQQTKNVQTDICRQGLKDFAGFSCFHRQIVQHYLNRVNRNRLHLNNIRQTRAFWWKTLRPRARPGLLVWIVGRNIVRARPATIAGGLGFERGKRNFTLWRSYNLQASNRRTGAGLFDPEQYTFLCYSGLLIITKAGEHPAFVIINLTMFKWS